MDGSATPRRWRALAALAAVALLVGGPAALTPGAATAQSAGDEQYVDPLAPDDGAGGQNGRAGDRGQEPAQPQGGSGEAPAPEPAAPAAPPAPAAGSDAAATSGDTEAAPAAALPRTGVDAWLLAAAGIALLGGGALLRRASSLRSAGVGT